MIVLRNYAHIGLHAVFCFFFFLLLDFLIQSLIIKQVTDVDTKKVVLKIQEQV